MAGAIHHIHIKHHALELFATLLSVELGSRSCVSKVEGPAGATRSDIQLQERAGSVAPHAMVRGLLHEFAASEIQGDG